MEANLRCVPRLLAFATLTAMGSGAARAQAKTNVQTPTLEATVTSFATSVGGNGWRYATATVHFQNRTTKPVALAADHGKVSVSDDRGNRYVFVAARGIGAISGTTADPKFVLPPGGGGDALFEMRWRGAASVEFGTVFDLGLTVRGVGTLESGQLKLGPEQLLEFSGLKNGLPEGPTDPRVDAGPFTARIVRAKAGTAGRRWMTLEMTVRLENTSDKPVMLGYESTSSYGTDDQGNRWGYGTAGTHDTSFSGIGLVTSAQADPQLTLAPGEAKEIRLNVVRAVGREAAGTRLTYYVALQGLEILPSGQVRGVRQYSLTFPNLALKP